MDSQSRILISFPTCSGVIECREPIEVVSYKIGVCKVSSSGKDCTTTFQKIGFNGHSSVVLCKPLTGRMHQIRVHLQYLGKLRWNIQWTYPCCWFSIKNTLNPRAMSANTLRWTNHLNISKSQAHRLFLIHGGGSRVFVLLLVVPFEYRLTFAFDVATCTDVFTKHWTIIVNSKSFSDSFAYMNNQNLRPFAVSCDGLWSHKWFAWEYIHMTTTTLKDQQRVKELEFS